MPLIEKTFAVLLEKHLKASEISNGILIEEDVLNVHPLIYNSIGSEITTQKTKFSIKNFYSKCDQFPADLITFTEEILNGKLHFLYSEWFEILLKRHLVLLALQI